MGLVHFGEQRFDARLVAFDKDGTLFSFHASWRPSFLEAVDRLLSQFQNRDEIEAALFHRLGYNAAEGTFGEDGTFGTATSSETVRAAATVLHHTVLAQLRAARKAKVRASSLQPGQFRAGD